MRASLEKIRGSFRNSAMSRRFSFEVGEITQGSRERLLDVTWCFVGSTPNSLEWLLSWLGFWAEAWCSYQAVRPFLGCRKADTGAPCGCAAGSQHESRFVWQIGFCRSQIGALTPSVGWSHGPTSTASISAST